MFLYAVFKVLTSNLVMLRKFLDVGKFGLGLSSDFMNPGVRVPFLTERAACLPARKAKRFGHTVWIRVMVFTRGLFFPR